MANELTIPEMPTKGDVVPPHILNPEAAARANEEAAAGISAGFPARVKAAQRTFTMVDGNGDETPYPPANLIADEAGNVYLPVIVLRAKPELSKTWYAQAYNPNIEGVAPDCFSLDSIRPDSSIAEPQSDVCASCPQNAWGSGTDQNGVATKGKACADTKILAVFVPGFGVRSFKVTPNSLKNWRLYVSQLSAAGIPLGTVKTLVGFELTASAQEMIFRFGGYIPEESLAKLAELSTSPDAEEIVLAKPALPAPAAQGALPETTKQPDEGTVAAAKESVMNATTVEEAAVAAVKAKAVADEAAAEKKVKAAATRKANKEKKEAAAAALAAEAEKKKNPPAGAGLDLDLGFDSTDPVGEDVPGEDVPGNAADTPAGAGPTDAELRSELGL